MKKLLFVSCLVIVFAFATAAMAQTRPIQLSLTPDIALYDKNTRIEGLVLGIWSENPQSAVALGIVSGSRGNSAGLSWSLLLNYADNYKGVHWAPVNYTKGNFLGWQSGLVNYTEGSMRGLQTGFVNYSGRLTGVQFGFVNFAEKAVSGVQIGLINLLPQNQWFTRFPNELAPGMILVNWRF